MRIFWSRRPSNILRNPPWFVLPDVESASWTDGLGDVDSTFQLSLASLNNPHFTRVGMERIILVPTNRDVSAPVYGPYDVTHIQRTANDRWVVRGRIGDFVQTDYNESVGIDIIRRSVRHLIGNDAEGLLANERLPSIQFNPYWRWIQSLGVVLLYSVLYTTDSTLLSGIRQSLREIGLTLFLDVDIVGSSIPEPTVRIVPLYPVFGVDDDGNEVAGYNPVFTRVSNWFNGIPTEFRRRRTNPRLEFDTGLSYHNAAAYPQLDTEIYNVQSKWRRRKIVAGANLGLATGEFIVFYQSGSLGPSILLPDFNGADWAQVEADITRWDLQNSTERVTLVRLVNDEWNDVGFTVVRPHHIISGITDAWLGGLGLGPEWLVRQVDHSWTATTGYSQTLTMTQWNGPFVRVNSRQI